MTDHNIPTSQLFVDWLPAREISNCYYFALKQTTIEVVRNAITYIFNKYGISKTNNNSLKHENSRIWLIFEIITQQPRRKRKTPDLRWKTQHWQSWLALYSVNQMLQTKQKYLLRLQILYALITLGHHFLLLISEGLQWTKLTCQWGVRCCLYNGTRNTQLLFLLPFFLFIKSTISESEIFQIT